MFDEILAAASRGSGGGATSAAEVEELMKALEASGPLSNVGLTGGAALRVQSLDKTMQATIVENKHFVLFGRLAKPEVSGIVDEWVEQKGVGGFLGGSTNTEAGAARAAVGDYARRHGSVKFLSTRRQVSLAAKIQQGIASAEGVEQAGGAKQLLSDAEYLCWEGDEAVVPTEFSGIFSQMQEGVRRGGVDPDNIVDLDGAAMTSFDPLAQAAAQIGSRDNFGTPTDLFLSPFAQADLDASLAPAYRVGLSPSGSDIALGAPVSAIRTSDGVIATSQDKFIRDQQHMTPFEVQYPKVAAKNLGMKPTLAIAEPEVDVESRFRVNRAGTYYYGVAGVSAEGQSPMVVSGAIAIGAGEAPVLTITRSAGQEETGYVIYRSRQDGTNAPADMREMCRIPASGLATTVFKDQNRKLPGATKAAMLNMLKSDTAIIWRQFLPMMKFKLYPTDSPVDPWLQLLWGYLRISKLRQHVVLINIVPRSAKWRPHKGE